MERVRFSSAAASIALAFASLCVFAQSDPTKEQYEVYSAFLRIQLEGHRGKDDLRVGRNSSSISSNTMQFKKGLTSAERQWEIRHRLPEIGRDTLESLGDCISQSFRLTREFTLPTHYGLTTPEQARGPYLQFSCVGLNRAGTQAAFLVSRLNSDCAVVKWVLMQKDANTGWAVTKESLETSTPLW